MTSVSLNYTGEHSIEEWEHSQHIPDLHDCITWPPNPIPAPLPEIWREKFRSESSSLANASNKIIYVETPASPFLPSLLPTLLIHKPERPKRFSDIYKTTSCKPQRTTLYTKWMTDAGTRQPQHLDTCLNHSVLRHRTLTPVQATPDSMSHRIFAIF